MKHFYPTTLSFLVVMLFVSCENRYRKSISPNAVNSNLSTAATVAKQQIDLAKDAYQVSAEEYGEFFTTRYGLLYQKFSDTPFTGRIVTVENGPDGKFVVADESWRNGKKDGASTRWFSNGIKMYERNYSDGKWNGTVTRWWPNGQKMYVRAYSEGVRHGEEATWRSDGTPIKSASKLVNISPSEIPSNPDSENQQSNEFSEGNNDSSISPESLNVAPFTPAPLDISTTDPVFEPVVEQPVDPITPPAIPDSTDTSLPVLLEPSPLPDISVVEDPVPATPVLPDITPPSVGEIAEPPTNPEVVLPGLPEPSQETLPSELPALPGFPAEPEGSDDLPALPGLPAETENPDVLPELPGLPDSGTELPPMPTEDDALPRLPPLPGGEGNTLSEDLPPLPPLP